MPENPNLLQHILYRLYRGRRTLVIGVLIVLLGAGAASIVGPDSAFHANPDLVRIFAAAGMFAITALVARFPFGSLDILCVALTIALLTVSLGPYGALTELADGERLAVGMVGLVLMSIVAVIFTYIGLVWVTCTGLSKVPTSQQTIVLKWRSPVPPEKVLDHLRVQPDITAGNITFGSTDSDGVIPAWRKTVVYDDNGGFTGKTLNSRIRILEEGDLSQAYVETIRDDAGMDHFVTVRVDCLPTKSGSITIQQEVYQPASLGDRIIFWLSDRFNDHMRHQFEVIDDLPRLAFGYGDPDVPILALGRCLNWVNAKLEGRGDASPPNTPF